MYEYAARLVRVVDGDTWIFDIDLGCSVWVHGRRIRASKINCPEVSTDAGLAAKSYAVDWFAHYAPDGMVILQTQKDRSDDYGRLLGTVLASGHTLNDDLLAAGYAAVYA